MERGAQDGAARARRLDKIPRRFHRSRAAASDPGSRASVRATASRSCEDVLRKTPSPAASDFCARWKIIWPRSREWRRLNSKSSASGKSRAPASAFDIDIRYDLVGTRKDAGREQRVGHWLTRWSRDEAQGWRVLRWQATEETLARAREPVFIDVTAQALGQTASYKNQMLRGVDHWRTVLDGACGIDVYGNNGLAVGDIDNDGFDDLYVCQPAGLPNRLYRNRGDGSFEDVTEASGVAVLDDTACALFADFENKGVQDLLVVCGGGPLLFLNQGNGKFSLKPDAFKFAQPPQGTFTHAAIADYDRDGRLDIYFCLYSYYAGLDQYRYPVPYFDARNGPPNFLLHNEGNATFSDHTQAAGLQRGQQSLQLCLRLGRSQFRRDSRPLRGQRLRAQQSVSQQRRWNLRDGLVGSGR